MSDMILRDVEARPKTFNEAERTIEAVICTDAPVPRMDARGPYFEVLDLDGVDLEGVRGVSVLDSHKHDGVASILGTVENAWRESNAIVARIKLSARADPALIEDVRAGVVRHLSIGYTVDAWSETNAD
ncbi:MAG: hypothetical protein ACREDO_07975 [Methyloceanibacter sp.]